MGPTEPAAVLTCPSGTLSDFLWHQNGSLLLAHYGHSGLCIGDLLTFTICIVLVSDIIFGWFFNCGEVLTFVMAKQGQSAKISGTVIMLTFALRGARHLVYVRSTADRVQSW